MPATRTQLVSVTLLACFAAPVVADHDPPNIAYVPDELIIRFEAPPSDDQLAAVEAEFPGIVAWRSLRHAPHPKNDPDGVHPVASVRA